MLISISGKSGSGKDLVAIIIQYVICLQNNNLGEHQKDFNYFKIATESNFRQSGWQIKKFAFKLKQICSILTGIPIEKFEDEEFKKSYLGEEWNYQKQDFFYCKENNCEKWIGRCIAEECIYPKFENKQLSVRELMQKLGTDAIRNHIHPNTWVNALFVDYKPTQYYVLDFNKHTIETQIQIVKDFIINRKDEITVEEEISLEIYLKDYCRSFQDINKLDLDTVNFNLTEQGFLDWWLDNKENYTDVQFYPNWIITDTRFPNELQAVRDRKGLCIKVVLLDEDGNPVINKEQHPSETSLDHITDWDCIISAKKGDIDSLIKQVKEFLIKNKII